MSGEPVKYSIMNAHWSICCDCGLAHYRYFEIDGKNVIEVVYRDAYKTEEIRAKDMSNEHCDALIKILRNVIKNRRKNDHKGTIKTARE